MRILNSIVDPRMGGPQRRSLDVATTLQDRGIETVFLIPEGKDSFDDAATKAGFETYRLSIPRPRSPSHLRENTRFLTKFRRTTRQISMLLDSENIDAVHANMPTNFQTALAAARTDTPLAWHFNDTHTPTPVRQISAKAGVRWADELVVAADAVHEYFFPPSVESRTIYAPVDLSTFEPDSVEIDESVLRRELGIPNDVPVVGTVGNLNPIKGHEYLLRAVSEIDNRGIDIAAPVAGAYLDSQETYYRNLLDLRSSLGLEEQVQFIGFRSDIPQLLSLFDVFVLPSVAEACPIVVLEAMAMECPVIATHVGGVPEEIPDSDHGWIVPPKNPDALANSISEALMDSYERHRRALNARNRVETEFSLKVCADRHEELYRSLVSE